MEDSRRTRRSSVTRRVGLAFSALLAAMLIAGGFGLLAVSADASSGTGSSDGDQVCSGLDSTKIDVSGQQLSVTVTAPDGKLISGYCVKSGSTAAGDGPHYVTLQTPQKSITLTYVGADGKPKAISHYSLSYVTAGGSEPEPTIVVPTVVFHNPTCEDMTASWQGRVDGVADSAGDGVTFGVTSGTAAPGATVTITATAQTGYQFAGEETTKTFTHTFTAVPTGCDNGGGPESVTPDVVFTNPTCEQQQAGWQGTRTDVIAYTVTGSVAPGSTVKVVAQVKPAFADTVSIAEGARTEWTHTFASPECEGGVAGPVGGGPTGGTSVLGPDAGTATGPSSATVPTLVEAGLSEGHSAERALQAQLGQAMIAAGLVVLLAVTWLVLRRTGGAHRA